MVGLFILLTFIPFSSPLNAKFIASATTFGSGRNSTVTASFNSAPHPFHVAAIDEHGRVSWSPLASQGRRSPLDLSAFSLPPPFPHLNPGRNTLELTLSCPHRAPCSIQMRAFCWSLPPAHPRRLVVVDIDGTVTRSDVGGHVLPLFGISWAQPGVAALMRAIASNGYYIVYLTSRPLFLADRTRRYLQWLDMPEAPVITSPDTALKSVHREVTGCAHVFKSKALAAISSVFSRVEGDSSAPVFHSAFGNRSTDMKAYAAAGVEPSRVFIVDPRGRLTSAGAATQLSGGSYSAMLQRVNELFPPLTT